MVVTKSGRLQVDRNKSGYLFIESTAVNPNDDEHH